MTIGEMIEKIYNSTVLETPSFSHFESVSHDGSVNGTISFNQDYPVVAVFCRGNKSIYSTMTYGGVVQPPKAQYSTSNYWTVFIYENVKSRSSVSFGASGASSTFTTVGNVLY